MRTTLTTKQNKSKCLNYRSGQRCGRLGRYLVSGKQRGLPFKFPVCEECKNALLTQGARLHSFSPKGYTVTESLFGPTSREYKPIAAICIRCGDPATSQADEYCTPCGTEITDAEHEYAAALAYERSCETH